MEEPPSYILDILLNYPLFFILLPSFSIIYSTPTPGNNPEAPRYWKPHPSRTYCSPAFGFRHADTFLSILDMYLSGHSLIVPRGNHVRWTHLIYSSPRSPFFHVSCFVPCFLHSRWAESTHRPDISYSTISSPLSGDSNNRLKIGDAKINHWRRVRARW